MQTTLAYFKALADETRLRLLCILQSCELSVNELVSILDMGQSRVSRHLKILSGAGLLQWRRDGLWVFYSAASSGEGHDFIKNILPFITLTPRLQQDKDLAARCIEERALKTRHFFNAIAENWDALNREILGSFDLAAAVCDALPHPCELAVDLGCGTGSVLERILPKAGGVVGVDGSSRMLDLARRRFAATPQADTRVSLRIGELDHLPLRDGEADFACINFVLHHLSDPLAALQEIRRILRPGGRLLVADFDKHTDESMRDVYGDRWLGFTPDTLRGLLTDAGFAVQTLDRHVVEKNLGLLLLTANNPTT